MRRMFFCAAAMVCLGLPGCASTGGSNTLVREHFEVDSEMVAAVNALAVRRGVDVTWINPPIKRVPANSGLRD